MVRHIVLLRLKDGFVAGAPSVLAAIQASREMADKIPEAATWKVHCGISQREGAADFVGSGDFADLEAVRAFLKHPEHVRTAGLCNAVSTATIADIHLPPEPTPPSPHPPRRG